MKCEVYRIEIEERAAGDALSAEASRHVGVCARCRELYEQRASLERLLGELARVEAPNDFEFRLRARLAEAESSNRPSWLLRRGFVPGVVSLALAAVFFLTATLTLKLRPGVGEQATNRAANAPVGTSEQVEVAETDESEAQPVSASTPVERGALREETARVERESRRAVVVAASASAAKEDSASRLRRERFGSAESEFRPAPYVNSAGANQVALDNPVAVPLQASPQPLKVMLSDERGGARVAHMKTVSFGGQQIVGRTKESAHVARSTQEGAW
ncbi:MAG TPA: hypothetical protein VGV59_11030 [Pyrinomonadaceae bacterium]|nr:hypothetical protein [Pyrinomonadaceae bacterium]